jgi:predicted metal-binding protein
MTTTIFVCDTCRWTVYEKCAPCGRTGGEILAGHVERLAVGVAGVEVRRQSCLMGCERHCNTAIGAPYAGLHRDSETGQVPFRQWPQAVKGHFMARIPAIGNGGEEC